MQTSLPFATNQLNPPWTRDAGGSFHNMRQFINKGGGGKHHLSVVKVFNACLDWGPRVLPRSMGAMILIEVGMVSPLCRPSNAIQFRC